MNIPSALNRELFVPYGELLLVAVEVQRARGRYRSLLRSKSGSCFLCVSVTKSKPQQLYISKVKKSGASILRRSQWTVEELRQVNGINPLKDSAEFELAFDNTVDHWVTRSSADKCIFVQVLYGACKTHLRGPSGGVVIVPVQGEGPAPGPAPRSLRIRRKSIVPLKQTHFVNCQPKLTRELPGQSDEGGVKRLVQRMTAALGKRKNRLRAAEDRTAELREAAQRFAHSARQLALKYTR
ncbi:syntaxin-binding protein 6-like isoform X2 [Eucyclogobius newberryi]|uniref:syntaxin-binding protein 6-like isoform X2 n=1 Tax=Eucyclogobius newberryi TaxID=166745 RepID=UPI003B5B2332